MRKSAAAADPDASIVSLTGWQGSYTQALARAAVELNARLGNPTEPGVTKEGTGERLESISFIPVPFSSPGADALARFSAAMQRAGGRKVFVSRNKRITTVHRIGDVARWQQAKNSLPPTSRGAIMKLHCLALACAVTLAGCNAPPMYRTNHYGQVPTNYESAIKDFLTPQLSETLSTSQWKFSEVSSDLLRHGFYTNSVLDTDARYGYIVCATFDASAAPGGPMTRMTEGVILHEGKVVQWLKGGWWGEINRCDGTKRIY